MSRASDPRVVAIALLALGTGCPNRQGVAAIASPIPIDFGSVRPDAGPQTRELVIQNVGGADLNLTSAGWEPSSGATAPDPGLELAGGSLGAVLPGQMTSLQITFSPSLSTGNPTKLVVQTDSSLTPELDVPILSQVDKRPPLPGLTLDFGQVPVGTQRTLSLQITTAGEADPPALSSVDTPFSAPPAINTDRTLFEQDFIFSPTAAQGATWPVDFIPCAGCRPQELVLSGTGIDALVFEDLDGGIVGYHDFGPVVVGANAAAQVQLVNQWNQPVEFVGLTQVSPPFTVSPIPPATILPDAGILINLQFTPIGEGAAQQATLVANYEVAGASTHSETFALMGHSISDHCKLSWRPDGGIFFGYVPNGQSTQQRVFFSNAGAFDCSVGNFEIFPSAAEPFTPLGATITVPAYGGTNFLEVRFKPVPKPGVPPIHQRGAILTFDTGDPTNPSAAISLSGSLQLEAYGASSWPKWNHDNGNTGLSPVDTAYNKGKLAWSSLLGAPSDVTYLQGPALDDNGSIYALSTNPDGPLDLLSRWDGGTLTSWPLQPPAWTALDSGFKIGGIESTPTLVSGNPWVAIATGPSQRVLTVSGADAGGFGSSAPIAGFIGLSGGFDGGLYVADDLSESVLRISEAAAPLQSWDLCGGGVACQLETFSGAAADDGTTYWTGGKSLAFALAPDGTELWSVQMKPMSLPGAEAITIHSAPALLISSGIVYGVGSYGVDCVAADGGATCAQVRSSVYALNQADGSVLWSWDLPPYDPSMDNYPIGYSSPALRGDGTVVVGYHDGVYLLGDQGLSRQHIPDPTSSGVVGSAAIGADGTIYVGTLGGLLLAIDEGTCDGGGFCIKWPYAPSATPTPSIGSTPAIGADGTVYFMAGGVLYAVQ